MVGWNPHTLLERVRSDRAQLKVERPRERMADVRSNFAHYSSR